MSEQLTPVAVEAKLRSLVGALTRAQQALAQRRDAEVTAKHAWERAKRASFFDDECPKPTRGGFTVADREAFIESRCADLREAYELAEVARHSAEDYLRVLRDQGVIVAALAKSVNLAYSMAGTGDR